ncbi:3-deoxy-D-manno-octulosonic acid transferase [Gemmobacter lanyuensis]
MDLWLHGASNGELTSARWVVERMLALRPDLRIVVTCNSGTARRMVAGWALPRVAVRLAPFDTPSAVARFRKAWSPRALICLENELWPERITQMAGWGRSSFWARGCRRVGPQLGPCCARVDGGDAGAGHASVGAGCRIGGTVSGAGSARAGAGAAADAEGPGGGDHGGRSAVCPGGGAGADSACGIDPSGEEGPILRAFAKAKAAGAVDLLILAPRHPRRGAEIAALIAAEVLTMARRSEGQAPGAETAVYLADTLGEMPFWYAMAGITVIGGTFGDAGGHTPYEPGQQGSCILHGPNVANFAEVFAALDTAGAAVPVTEESLATVLTTLPEDRQAELAAAATRVLQPQDEGR